MPTLPWTSGPTRPTATDGECLAMASRFELTTYRQVVPFFVAALRVYSQVRRSDGARGVTLIAHPLRREFFTLSSWRDRDAVDAMIRVEPHRSVMTAFREHTEDARFVFWTLPAGSRPSWTEARRRLADDVKRTGG